MAGKRCHLLLVQLVCVLWPSPGFLTSHPVGIDAFVLSRRSVDDNIVYDDYGDRYDEVPLVDYDNMRLEPKFDVDRQRLFDNLVNSDGGGGLEEPNYLQYDNENEYWDTPDLYENSEETTEDGSDSIDGKMPLGKEDLRQMFAGGEEDKETEKKRTTTDLTKSEVEKLFQADNSVDALADSEPEVETNESESVVQLPSNNVVGAAVEKVIHSVHELQPNGEVTNKKVIDVKEQKIVPETGQLITKEWTAEVGKPEGENVAMKTEPQQWTRSRKSKRSMGPSEEGGGQLEEVAKQRAVQLLKTYIELQADENHHLTQALNLATLAQTQRTDRYLGQQIEHLHQAIDGEQEIETIRDMIKEDEGDDLDIDVDEDQGQDTLDYEDLPITYDDRKRGNVEQLNDVFMPSALEDENPEEEEEDDDESYEKNAFLRDRLRQYLLSRVVDDDDDDSDAYWTLNNDIYSDSRLNPFTREIEAMHRYGPEFNPDWLKEIQAAAVLTQLHDAVDASTRAVGSPLGQLDEDDGICPAVIELSDNCMAARTHGLVLDDEAMALCNRHQLCYLCGSELDLTAEMCDEGYLSEAELLCSLPTAADSPGRCRGEATGLYVIMTDGDGHRYHGLEESPDICRHRCVFDYIVNG